MVFTVQPEVTGASPQTAVEVTVRSDEYRRLQKACRDMASQCVSEDLQKRWLNMAKVLSDRAHDANEVSRPPKKRSSSADQYLTFWPNVDIDITFGSFGNDHSTPPNPPLSVLETKSQK